MKRITLQEINHLIETLNSIARTYDSSEYGLPITIEPVMLNMQQAVKTWTTEHKLIKSRAKTPESKLLEHHNL